MANAGRVAIVPKGDWSAAVEYKRLDAVAYNNTLYIAKKAVPAGTLPTDTAYWMKCVVGGVGAIATTEDAGSVKAGDDIGVDSTGEMSLKTDFTAQEELAELTGTEDRQTFFGKIAKAVSSLISHISLGATADKAGHVKLSSSSAVTDSTGLALPATEKNASLDGTMANQIAALNKSFASRYLGMQVSNCIMNGFVCEAAFVNGECEVPLVNIGLAGCNTDDWYVVLIFGNIIINEKIEPVFTAYASENVKIKLTLPLSPSYNGTPWVNGIAIATRK